MSLAPPALAEVEIELSASTARYRSVDLSYTHASGVVLDALYLELPGLSLKLLGAGYEFELGEENSLTPLVYGVPG